MVRSSIPLMIPSIPTENVSGCATLMHLNGGVIGQCCVTRNAVADDGVQSARVCGASFIEGLKGCGDTVSSIGLLIGCDILAHKVNGAYVLE